MSSQLARIDLCQSMQDKQDMLELAAQYRVLADRSEWTLAAHILREIVDLNGGPEIPFGEAIRRRLMGIEPKS